MKKIKFKGCLLVAIGFISGLIYYNLFIDKVTYDVNGDGIVDKLDALKILRYYYEYEGSNE